MSQSYFQHESAVIDEGARIGNQTKIWHFSHIMSKVEIGERCSLGQNVFVGNNVRIGNNVKIQNNVSIYEGVTLEDDVFCGPSMVFTNVKNPRSSFPQESTDFYSKTIVKQGATIGANATIVCGVTLGRWSFIGAGSVVIADVTDYSLLVGNPGRKIGWMCECGTKLASNLECTNCNRKYDESNNSLRKLE